MRHGVCVINAIIGIQHFGNHHLTCTHLQCRGVETFLIHGHSWTPCSAVFFVQLDCQAMTFNQWTARCDVAADHCCRGSDRRCRVVGIVVGHGHNSCSTRKQPQSWSKDWQQCR